MTSLGKPDKGVDVAGPSDRGGTRAANGGIASRSPAFSSWASRDSTSRRNAWSPAQHSSNTPARPLASASNAFSKMLSILLWRSESIVGATRLKSGSYAFALIIILFEVLQKRTSGAKAVKD